MMLNAEQHKTAFQQFTNYFALSNHNTGLDFLREILSRFSKLPYENISKIIKHHEQTELIDKIRLPEEVIAGHIQHHLGGTCFSLTFSLQTILTRAGFQNYPIMADMRWGNNVHCALIMPFEGSKYLIDPGYLLNQPMALSQSGSRIFDSEFSGVELAYHPDTMRYDLNTFNRFQKKWRYSFSDEPVDEQTFLKYWIDSFGWNTMHGLCLTRVERGRMVYVHKTFMRETTFDGKQNFNIKKNYHETIHHIFGIHPHMIDEALGALDDNLKRERDMGLWVPKRTKKTKPK